MGEAEPGDGLDEFLNCVFTFLLEVVVAVSDSVVEDIRGDLFVKVLWEILIIEFNIFELLFVSVADISEREFLSFLDLFDLVLKNSVSCFECCLPEVMRRCASEVISDLLLVLNNLLWAL